MAVFGCRPTRRLKYDSYAKFFKSSSPTRSRGRGLPSSIAVLALSHPITGSEDCCARATGQAASAACNYASAVALAAVIAF